MLLEQIRRNKCFITGEDIDLFGEAKFKLNKSGYRILINNKCYSVQFDIDVLDSLSNDNSFIKFLDDNRYVFKGHIYNDRWFSNDERDNMLVGYDELKELLNRFSYPKSPTEKKERLFLELSSMFEFDGDEIDINYQYSTILSKCYFRNQQEMSFYLDTLVDEGLFEVVGEYAYGVLRYKLTFKGLSELAKLNTEGANSNRCFVAMSFDQEDQYIFETIRQACYDANKYEAFTVKDEHLDSVQTINDGIIAGIKKAKFCIADFTKQKDGVYFEAGYAAGRGMKVIYTCREDHWKDTHFDTNHFPHIIYKNEADLKVQLINKIQAWIV